MTMPTVGRRTFLGGDAMGGTANPIDTSTAAWIPLRDGVSFRPLHFRADGYALQLRVEPGRTITRHRHSGDVHALNLSGCRELIETGELAGPGTYVYEPPGNVDSWRCVGEVPCVVQITLTGRIEYLDDAGCVIGHSDSDTARQAYLAWCRRSGVVADQALGLRPDGTLAD
jgi:2,4'-dihydroxyacetophenone dioxygenase